MENISNWYIGILLGSLILTGNSVYTTTSTNTKNAAAVFPIHVVTTVLLTSLCLLSLSFAAAEHWRTKARFALHRGKLRPLQLFPQHIAIAVTRITGVLASTHILALPVVFPGDEPIVIVSLRIPCFFYACKILDLTLVRAHAPPIPRGAQKDETLYGLVNWKAHSGYMWRVFSEMRYASFDIAVDDAALRKDTPSKGRFWTYGPLVLVPLTWLFPIPELMVLTGLLMLQVSLEGLHLVMHPRCPNRLFRQPFAAGSISEFWGRRWHFGAHTFLHSLGYVPARTIFGKWFGHNVGRAAGALSAFCLSGVWHGWCGTVLTKDEYAFRQGVGLWAVFMLQGVGVLAERTLFRDEKWKRGWRQTFVTALGWVYSVETASIWLRYAEATAKNPLARRSTTM